MLVTAGTTTRFQLLPFKVQFVLRNDASETKQQQKTTIQSVKTIFFIAKIVSNDNGTFGQHQILENSRPTRKT